MKLPLIALTLALVSNTVLADDLIPVGGGTAHSGAKFISYVDKTSVVHIKNGMVRFLIVSHFEKPQTVPDKSKKTYDLAVQGIIADCHKKTLFNPRIAFMKGKEMVAQMATGETKLGQPPANAKVMLDPAIETACKTASQPVRKSKKS